MDLMRPNFFAKRTTPSADKTWIIVAMVRGDSFGAAGIQRNLVRRVKYFSRQLLLRQVYCKVIGVSQCFWHFCDLIAERQ